MLIPVVSMLAQRVDRIHKKLFCLGMYMDRRCVYYHKPLLESGTLGTKGNVQVQASKYEFSKSVVLVQFMSFDCGMSANS